jgi:hypothetical protein
MLAVACGPGSSPNLGGTSDVGGETTTGDGDGDGDGDGEPSDCIERSFGSATIHLEDHLDASVGNDHDMCVPESGPDYSIAWVAPQDGPYQATLDTDTAAWLTLLRGGCDGTSAACWSPADFYAVAGQDYTFVIESLSDETSGAFTFTLEPKMAVPGECPIAELSTGVWVPGSTLGGDDAFSSSCGGQDAPEHAYVFYPPATGTYLIQTQNSDYDSMLYVFEGYCSGAEVDCTHEAALQLDLEVGRVYTIVVDGSGGRSSQGHYELELQLSGVTHLCDNTEDLGSDVPAGASWSSTEDTENVWELCSPGLNERRHLWTAPAAGYYRVSLEGGPSSSVSVSLDCGGSGALCGQGGPVVFESGFAWNEVLIISEWAEGEFSDMNLLVEAIDVTPGCGVNLPEGVPVVSDGLTSDHGDQYDGSCTINPAPEIEYWWTAPATASYLLSLENSDYDTTLYVRDSGCDGVELGCNDDTLDGQNVYPWSSLVLELTAGQTISIFVDGQGESGYYQLNITQL